MRNDFSKIGIAALFGALVGQSLPVGSGLATAGGDGWNGRRAISYQHQKDLFYNYYAQPGPYNGAAAGMYPAPGPVPPHVGHTYVTYQPFMPHEFMHKHKRSYYTYNPGAGWRRTNVRYGTGGLFHANWATELHPLRTNNIWALHNDFYHPGLRW